MLNRRDFAGLITASLTSSFPRLRAVEQPGLVQPRVATAQTSVIKTSVMMWALDKSGAFEQNLERVTQAGYNQIELVNEFKTWSESDSSRILARIHALGITVDAMAGMTLGFGDPAGGDAFLAELNSLIPIALRLGCRQIILLSGKRKDTASSPGQDASTQLSAQHTACIGTLKLAAHLLTKADLVGVIEPIDRLENPSIFLDGVTEAFAIVRAVGNPAIRVLYDLYHEQRTKGNLIQKLEDNIKFVGLIHVADVPGRHEQALERSTTAISIANSRSLNTEARLRWSSTQLLMWLKLSRTSGSRLRGVSRGVDQFNSASVEGLPRMRAYRRKQRVHSPLASHRYNHSVIPTEGRA